MKRVLLISVFLVVMLFLGTKISATAENIKSKGKMEGILNFCVDDIRYLEKEIKELMEECGEDK